MTDAERLAAIVRAGITDDQLASLASGRLVLWMDEGVRRDEREACARIIDDHAEGSHGNVHVLVERTDGNLAGTAYATAIRARSTLSK